MNLQSNPESPSSRNSKANISEVLPLIKEEKNGFIRMDFYKEAELKDGLRGVIAAVSERVEGNNDWQEKQVEEVAPEGVKFMRVSLQSESAQSDFYFDEIKVYETDANAEEIEAVNKPEIDNTILYPQTIL